MQLEIPYISESNDDITASKDVWLKCICICTSKVLEPNFCGIVKNHEKSGLCLVLIIAVLIITGCSGRSGNLYPPFLPEKEERIVVANLVTPKTFNGSFSPVSLSSIKVEGDINSQEVVDDTIFAFFTWFCPLFSNFETTNIENARRDYSDNMK